MSMTPEQIRTSIDHFTEQYRQGAYVDFLNDDKVQGVGYILKSASELIVKDQRNTQLALTDFFKGLGLLGVHTNILSAMQTPDGQVAAVFQKGPEAR